MKISIPQETPKEREKDNAIVMCKVTRDKTKRTRTKIFNPTTPYKAIVKEVSLKVQAFEILVDVVFMSV